MWSATELIVAPATGPGPGGRAIVRLAGDGLAGLLAALFTPLAPAAGTGGFVPPGASGRVVSARLAAAGLGREWGGVPVEILHWPGPTGPIGGPLAEVQLPASGPLVDAIVQEACRLGARLARGGEFTLRGFLSGRLDLVQAEAVLGVVDARSPAELAVALDRLAGGAGERLRDVRDSLLDLLADVEAAIDFADETTPDSVPVAGDTAWRGFAFRLAAIQDAIARATRAVADRGGGTAAEVPRVVLVGRPNVGKSALFNALVGRQAALVANELGTTRDWLESRLPADDGDAAACMLVDLAGVPLAGEMPGDALAAAAVARSREEAARADVVVVCRDAGEWDRVDPGWLDSAARDAPRIFVATRCDRVGASPVTPIATSATTGAGIGDLRRAIHAVVATLPARGSPATQRLAAGLESARQAIGRAAACVADPASPDEALVAAHLHRAVESLGDVTGLAVGTDLLDRIFSRHCVGK